MCTTSEYPWRRRGGRVSYAMRGPRLMVVDQAWGADWRAGNRAHILAIAQGQADGTGKSCAVFTYGAAPESLDWLTDVAPTPKPAPPAAPVGVFSRVTSWLGRNLQDPDEDA